MIRYAMMMSNNTSGHNAAAIIFSPMLRLMPPLSLSSLRHAT